MSIIYDALKKIENQKKPLKVKPEPEFLSGINSRVREKLKSHKKSKLPWFLGLVCITGFFLFMVSTNLNKKTDVRSFIIENDQTGAIQISQKPVRRSAVKKQPDKRIAGEYNLEGIVYDDHNPFAIVNGKILKRNDKLDELVVIDITESEVEFLNSRDSKRMTLGISF